MDITVRNKGVIVLVEENKLDEPSSYPCPSLG